MMRLYLVRHPRPEQIDGICYGRLDVTVASVEMRRAVESIGNVVPDTVFRSASLYSSPAQRCILLARQLANDSELTISNDLAEIDFGRWEGRSWDAVPREEIDAWAAGLWDYRPGGGESARMVLTRWQRFCDGLRSIKHETVVAVTHAGIIRLAYTDMKRVEPENMWRLPIEFGSVHQFEIRST